MKNWILKTYSKCKKEVVISFLAICFYIFIMILAPFAVRVIVEYYGIHEPTILTFTIGILILFVVYGFETLANIVWNLSLDRLGSKFMNHLTNDIILKMIRTDYREIEKLGLPKIKSIVYSDVFDCFRLFGNFIPTMISSMIIVVISIAYSFTIEATTSWIIVLACVLGFILAFLAKNRLSYVGRKTNQAMKKIHAQDMAVVDTLVELKINRMEDIAIQENNHTMDEFVEVARKEDTRTFFWSGIIDNYNSILTIGISLFLAYFVKGYFIQNLLFYSVLLNLIFVHTQKIENALHKIFKLKTSVNNIVRLYALKEDEGNILVNEIQSIRFEDVSYGYTEKNVINHISFFLEKGDIVHLVGQNGSGKSTIVKLLLGIYQGGSGILVNDTELSCVDKNSYWSRICYIGQEEKLINGSISNYPINNLNPDIFQMLEIDQEKKIVDNGENFSLGERKKNITSEILCSF